MTASTRATRIGGMLARVDMALAAAWAWCQHAARKAVYTVHLVAVLARSWVRTTVKTARAAGAAAGGGGHGPSAYQVYVFNEDEGQRDGGFHCDMSPTFLSPSTWEQDARDYTSWSKFRVELRYVFRNKRYRMVLRPGDACIFPPYESDASEPRCRLPKGVLSARLQGPPGSGIDHDVTSRVLKYQGPRGDFHSGLGLRVRLQDMFPFDDHSDNGARFTHLRVLDTMARVHDLSYALNPYMHIPK